MAVLSGIAGMNMTGANGQGNIALSIETRVLRILADMDLSYIFATMQNPASVKAGTASYYVPEIVGAEDYGTGTSPFNKIGAGLVSLNLDTRRTVKYEYEEFDVERLDNSDYIVGMISSGIAMGIQADLNAQFLDYLIKQFDSSTGDANVKNNIITLSNLGTNTPIPTPDKAFEDYLQLEYKQTELSTTFDKTKLGVPIAEFFCILSPKCDVGMRIAFRNQPNSVGQWQIANTLVGKQIGNVKYKTDKMLDKNIPAGSSFRKEALDTTGVWGFMLHTEAVAMPMNLERIHYLLNPENGNPRFVAKYQFGIGILRPDLVYMIKNGAKK